ncbi:MAG: leucine-rich repeat protein [Lachnospiraceae bacterium]|nr:leucine-rich repeat protein [Lachnospiraceae bacterium]
MSMKVKRAVSKITALIIALAMVFATGRIKMTAYADGPDPTTTLQTAFTAFDSNEKVFVQFSLTGEGNTLIASEKVELDRTKNVKNALAQDVDSGTWTTIYTDLAEKVSYYQDDGQWYKYPTEEEDLVGLGKTLKDNGVETSIVTGAVYTYAGEEKKSVVNSHTGVATEFDCNVFKADIPVVITDDEEDEDADDEDDEDEDDPDEEKETEIITVYYYIAKDSGTFVHAETREGLIVNADIAYPAKDDPAVELVIPEEAVENAILEEGYETPQSATGSISYKVVYKGKKAYLSVVKGASKKKLTVPKSVKILGKAYPVQEIGASAFASNKKLQTLVIKADINKIGKKAFYNSKKLKTITINSKKVKSVGKNSFDTYSKKLIVKLSGNKKYKAKVKKLIDKSRAKKAVKKTKLTVK